MFQMPAMFANKYTMKTHRESKIHALCEQFREFKLLHKSCDVGGQVSENKEHDDQMVSMVALLDKRTLEIKELNDKLTLKDVYIETILKGIGSVKKKKKNTDEENEKAWEDAVNAVINDESSSLNKLSAESREKDRARAVEAEAKEELNEKLGHVEMRFDTKVYYGGISSFIDLLKEEGVEPTVDLASLRYCINNMHSAEKGRIDVIKNLRKREEALAENEACYDAIIDYIEGQY